MTKKSRKIKSRSGLLLIWKLNKPIVRFSEEALSILCEMFEIILIDFHSWIERHSWLANFLVFRWSSLSSLHGSDERTSSGGRKAYKNNKNELVNEYPISNSHFQTTSQIFIILLPSLRYHSICPHRFIFALNPTTLLRKSFSDLFQFIHTLSSFSSTTICWS